MHILFFALSPIKEGKIIMQKTTFAKDCLTKCDLAPPLSVETDVSEISACA